jgi:hypothetical protein
MAGRGLLFVGIVWSIAGAFLVLHFGQPELLDRLIQARWIPPELSIPLIEPAASCTSRGANTLPDPAVKLSDPAEIREVRYASWRLGINLGFAADFSNFKAGRVAPFMQEAETLAAALPKIQHLGSALHEFAVYLESDPQCVATRLTSRYGPSYGYLYKSGAVIGHATLYRAQGMTPFVPQIQSYGQLAGIPQELWLPMTQGTPASWPDANMDEEVFTDVQRLDNYIKAGQ